MLGFTTFCRAFGPDGEAILESIRDRIAAGRGGEEAYRDMLAVLSENPGWGCGDEVAEATETSRGEVGHDAVAEALAEKCPDTGGDAAPRSRRPPGIRIAGIQSVRPRDAGRSDARWAASARSENLKAQAAGAGAVLRDRSLRLGPPRLALHLGHIAPALAEGRVRAVVGRSAYTGGGASGLEGPLSAPRSALDGLALTARAGTWRLHAAGAWNRLAPLGNMPDTLRRDAGLMAAGLARLLPAGRDGWGLRTQAMALRLEADGDAPAWITVAGMEASARRAGWRYDASAAVSREDSRGWAGMAETRLGSHPPDSGDGEADGEGSWELRGWQSGPGWANPLSARRGSLRDTLAGGLVVPAGGEGGASLAAALPIGALGQWRVGLQAGGGLAWIARRIGSSERDWPDAEDLARGEGRVALIQSSGPWTWSSGSALGWRRQDIAGSGAGGWGHALEWRRDGWRARARWTRMPMEYAGARPEPLSLGLGRGGTPGGKRDSWNLEWSTADLRDPWRSQRMEARQEWHGGAGVRVEQRLRLPWSPDGLAAGLDYQLGLSAEF